ncbi:YdeI/OmpD-associated family protein [Flavobacterium poyangense]|uniref:YdeI/OmpD-associated family protein n=1 Tax=Flavobacterium poyangense TaxID=2204302 RepID=UPI0014215B02|nr:DUF1801 domain-containing protein [Flavobacterium sp. JXAS1]
MNPKVDFYFEEAKKWKEEQEELRRIALDCQLTEELKWDSPCYTFQNNNIVLIHAFKDYCAFLFFKGALLKDTDTILNHQSKNTQATRQIRFTNVKDIAEIKATVKAYIYEAIEIEKAGLQVIFKKTEEFDVAEEFQRKLDELPYLKTAFEALTPGRQRGYLLYFSQSKQSKTRETRIEKVIPQILAGKGLKDI